MWPTQKPRLAPLKRPSVSRQTSSLWPWPARAPGHRQHLAHAGAALWPFVADHQHVARFDLAAQDGLEGRLLPIEYARRRVKWVP